MFDLISFKWVHNTRVEIPGLWCASDGISCRLGSVCVISFFRVYLLFPSKHLTCTDPEKCLWEGKGLPSSTPKEIHTKASCKSVVSLVKGFSPVQWGAEPSSLWPVLISCCVLLWFHDLIFFHCCFLQVEFYRQLPLSVQRST